MIKEFELSLKPAEAASPGAVRSAVVKSSGMTNDEINHFVILRRSIDARRHPVWIRLLVRVYTHSDLPNPEPLSFDFKDVANAPPVIIAGTGPAGLFAALRLIENGIRPILLERGKDVSQRKHDIARINREHKVNPDSNYCFGEGGAGTFSDGKLYTRSNKRGNTKRVLEMMVWHGASAEILIDTHPHVGSDQLLPLIIAIRNTILDHGGEIHFNTTLTDIQSKNGVVTAFVDQHGNTFEGKAYILATGHSARDIFNLMHMKNWPLLFKPFALGVRVEHPQSLINSIQYHAKNPDALLPPATYNLAAQFEDRGVFSFCMCPGGIIIPSATHPDQVVVNGMSNSRRNSPFANAGIVTEVREPDLADDQAHGPLAGIVFQEKIERDMRVGGLYSQKAPAQRLTDFLQQKYSSDLPESSYVPGLQSTALHELLPPFITTRLSEGFKQFNRKMKGFITEEAVIVGVESRTSSPVRIPRDPEKLHYTHLQNLYPCGEGAGYSGGIVSSAIDGDNAAQKIIEFFNVL